MYRFMTDEEVKQMRERVQTLASSTDHIDRLTAILMDSGIGEFGLHERSAKAKATAIVEASTRPVNEQMLGALKRLVSGISTCHSCGAQLLSERGAAHCEDCPSGCEAHDAPDCPQIDELIEAARAAISSAEAAQKESEGVNNV